MLTIRAEDTARLAVNCQAKPFAAVSDDARRFVQCGSEIGALPHVAFEIGKQAGHGVGIVPDVRAGALATAGAFQTPEPSRGKAVRGRTRQARRIEHRAVEEPVGRRGIIPGVVPGPRLGVERNEMRRHMLGDGRRSSI